MARVFTDGAEMGDALFWDSWGGSVAAGGVDGDYYYYLSTQYQGSLKSFSSLSEFYFRERIYTSGLGSNLEIPRFYSGGSTVILVEVDTLRHLTVKVGTSTLVGTSSLILNGSRWYLIEIYLKIADSPNGIVQVKIDGTLEIDYSGDTAPGVYSINNIQYTGGNSVGIDDLALNDTTGGVDDSWCGDGTIVMVYPNGNGTDNDWTGNDADSVDNYLLVDDIPSDGDTTYVEADSGDSGLQDQYAMSDYDGAGYTILRIYPECRAKLSAASANQLKLGILPSGGADQTSAGMSLTTGGYDRYVGDDYLVNPADAGAWEEADIDAIEGILEVA